MKDWLDDLKDNWLDDYWRLRHPELVAVAIAIATGLVGLVFAWAQAKLLERYSLPRTGDV